MARPGYWTPGPEVSERERSRRKRFLSLFMSPYWTQRQAWVEALEHATAMYSAEVEEFKQDNPPLLFKDYLIQSSGMPR